MKPLNHEGLFRLLKKELHVSAQAQVSPDPKGLARLGNGGSIAFAESRRASV